MVQSGLTMPTTTNGQSTAQVNWLDKASQQRAANPAQPATDVPAGNRLPLGFDLKPERLGAAYRIAQRAVAGKPFR